MVPSTEHGLHQELAEDPGGEPVGIIRKYLRTCLAHDAFCQFVLGIRQRQDFP